MNHVDYLRGLNACLSGVEYATKYQSLREAWEKCERPDWMLWFLCAAGIRDAKRYRLYACWCVRNTPIGDGRVTWDLLDGPHRNLVVVAERFALGHATREQLDAAGYASSSASASAAIAASSSAASSAADSAADYAAIAAAGYAAAAAEAAAIAAAHRAQADQLREMFAEEFNRIEAMADMMKQRQRPATSGPDA